MKIGFFTESDYTGQPVRNSENMRTDVAWVVSLNATHHPIYMLPTLEDDKYDVGIMIFPHNKKQLHNFPLLEQYKRVCKKVTIMQESTQWEWQDGSIADQVLYYNTLVEMDLLFCHNDCDKEYFRGLTGVKTEILPTLMIEDVIEVAPATEHSDSAFIHGNWMPIYRGFDAYIIAKQFEVPIYSSITGRMHPDEKQMDINHLPWILWKDFMYELSKHRYGVQCVPASAGQFPLNCGYLGIPCIGFNDVNCQKYIHPALSVDVGDLATAKMLAIFLKGDAKFYKKCSEESKENYKKYYHEDVFNKHMNKIMGDLTK